VAKQEILDRLTEGIAGLTQSGRWREWLAVQSRFHRYSFHNALLIHLQRPDATQVAGFRTWRSLGRSVRRREAAIRILAPLQVRAGAPEEGDARRVRGFRTVSVFDVAQTDGDPLPEVCALLEGDDPGQLFGRLRSVAGELGFTVEERDDLGGAHGDCSHALRAIRILGANPGAQRVKTLAHELAHAILHDPKTSSVGSRALAELEAESVAFVVCEALGVAADGYSFGYVAVWSGGGPEAIERVRGSAVRIQAAAHRILASAEQPSAHAGPAAGSTRR
jgi:N-terminal domain of anti-restriction factor ArdC